MTVWKIGNYDMIMKEIIIAINIMPISMLIYNDFPGILSIPDDQS